MGFTDETGWEDLGSSEGNGGKYVENSGVYFGTITRAEYTHHTSGAASFSVGIETVEGKILDYVNINVVKKDGSDSFGMAFYKTMCKMTNSPLSEPKTSAQSGKKGFPQLYGKKIGIGVQLEYDGGKYPKKNLVGVYSFVTKQCASEIAENSMAKKWMIPITDKIKDNQKQLPPSDTNGNSETSGLPF